MEAVSIMKCDEQARERRIMPYYLLGVCLFAAKSMSRNPTDSGVFETFWTSGYAVSHGLDPYAVHPATRRVTLDAPRVTIVEEDLNPPCMLPLFQAIANLPISVAALFYIMWSFLMLTTACALIILLNASMQRVQAVWIMLSAPALAVILSGQLYALLLLCGVLMWAALRRGNVAIAAVFLGAVVAMKPIFFVWILLIAFDGMWSLAWMSAAIAFSFSVVPVFLYGPSIYERWLTAAAHDEHYLYLTNISLAAVGRRCGFAVLGVIAACALFAACVRRRRISQRRLHMMGIVASCFCGPPAWYLYLVVAYPWFLERKWDRWERQWAALLLLIPIFVPSAVRRIHGPAALLWIGSAICIAPAVLMLIDAMRRDDPPNSQVRDATVSSALA